MRYALRDENQRSFRLCLPGFNTSRPSGYWHSPGYSDRRKRGHNPGSEGHDSERRNLIHTVDQYIVVGYSYPFQYSFNFPAPNSVAPATYPNGTIATLENGLSSIPLDPGLVNASGLTLRGIQLHYKTAYVQSYNLTVQYQLTPNDSLDVGYVASLSRHLETFVGTNLICKAFCCHRVSTRNPTFLSPTSRAVLPLPTPLGRQTITRCKPSMSAASQMVSLLWCHTRSIQDPN